jgi:hypothetical protein
VTTECEALRRDIIVRGVPAGKVTVIPCAEQVSDARARDAAPASGMCGTDELHGGQSYCRVYEHLMGAT